MGNRTLAIGSVRLVLAGMAAAMIASEAWAGTAILSWNANTEPNLAGYRVYYGESRPYSQRLDVGKVRSYTVGGLLDGRTYYFVVTAYNSLNVESAYSNEVSKTIPDATPPQLSSIAAGSLSSSSATISWLTNEAATSQVDFGLTTAYGSSSPLDTALLTSHRVALQGLALGTLYHYRVRSRDAAGNLAVSGDATFRTASTADTTPPVISAVAASSVTATGATITWTTNEPSDSRVTYGPTTAYGSSTPLNITMVTSHRMTLSGLAAATTYHYRVASRDAAGNLGTSADFTFTTAASGTTSRLTNLSTRGLVQTGAEALIGGFIVSGTSPKTVLVRARGPSLVEGGVAGAIANPYVEIFSGSTKIAQNDNWQTTDPLCGAPAVSCGSAAEIAATTVDPCDIAMTGCALDSAIMITLPPGPYTAIVSGVGGGTGVGIVEAIDLDSTATPRLVNISARGLVQTGESVMIGGFVVGSGVGEKTLLVRARGPSLAALGVSGVLADPSVEIYSGSTLIARNDNWRTTDLLCGSPAVACGDATDIQNTGRSPCSVTTTGCTLDSAVHITLPPGAYTMILRGVGGGTGVGIVEVVDLSP